MRTVCSASCLSSLLIMKRTLFLSTFFLTTSLVPVSALAAEQLVFAPTTIASANPQVSVQQKIQDAKEQLAKVQMQRILQEKEYARSFSVLSRIQEELMIEEKTLQNWLQEQIQEENRLLTAIQVQGAPHNVLKIRARQRQLQNAKKLFGEQRDSLKNALQEKNEAWKHQWNALTSSQAISRMKFTKAESALREQLDNLQFDKSALEAMNNTKMMEASVQAVREERDMLRAERYRERVAKRAQAIQAAVEKAKEDNYFTRDNPTVVADIAKEKQAEIDFEQSMQLKTLIERLGIIGPVNDQLRASLYLHLFGSLPAEQETDEVSAQ